MKIGMTRKGFIGVVVAGIAGMFGLSYCSGMEESPEAVEAEEAVEEAVDTVSVMGNDSTTASSYEFYVPNDMTTTEGTAQGSTSWVVLNATHTL